MHGASKPRRADAVRNEGKILEAALTQFFKEGVDTSLDGIAKEAGVGAGTLYRHFPTREELIASALAECRTELETVQKSLMEREDSLSALQEWLHSVRDYVKTFQGLAVSLLDALRDPSSALSPTCVEMQHITAQFLQRAQAAGAARANISARDLFVAQLALACVEDIALDSHQSTESLEHLLRHGYVVPDRSS